MPITQPMPRPTTRGEYEAAKPSMIDTHGRPLVIALCMACRVEHFTVEPCLSMVPCPHCGSTRSRCMRPSEHEAAGWHTERIEAFDQLRDRLESQGIAQVAKWAERATLVVEPDMLDLWSESAERGRIDA